MKEKELGLKDDKSKLRWDLLPMETIEEVVKVLTMGANKYAPNNWQLVDNAKDRYYAAAMRHIVEWRKGNKIDDESKLNHLSHVMCNIMFLLWLDMQGNTNQS
jgi:CRISPR/Cas system CMR-associated protein Cmr3 (group 5 of RAMP superfamily)